MARCIGQVAPPPPGAARPEPIVHPVGGARARRTAAADDEIGIGVDVAAIDVNHTGLANERLAVAQRELDAVVARLHLEPEGAGRIRGYAVALQGRQVHELDGAAVYQCRSFGAANPAADDEAGLRRGIGFEDRRGAPAAPGRSEHRQSQGQPDEAEETSPAVVGRGKSQGSNCHVVW